MEGIDDQCRRYSNLVQSLEIDNLAKLAFEEVVMDCDWDNDVCCATCIHGSEVKDADEGYMTYCQKKDKYMPDDGACEDHKY